MTAHVFVAGPTSWNILVRLDRLPESRPHMVRASGHTTAIGGTSAGKALHLALLGVRVTLRTLVGTDALAEKILSRLDRGGIEVLAETTSGSSEQHLNLMTPAGERLSIYLEVPVLDHEHHAERTREALGSCDVAVIDLAEHSRPLLAEARRLGVEVWCDLHDYDGRSAFHQEFVDTADVLFLNDDGLSDPLAFMQARVRAGTRMVVCTQGADGASAVTVDGALHVPAAPVHDILDTNGAGDAFLSGFLSSHLAGGELARCMDDGHAQAASALRVHDLAPES